MINKFSLLKKDKGFGIIEALIGITIAGLLLAVFSTLIYETAKINRINSNNIKAAMYLQELIEIAKDLEQDPAWTELSTTASPCHPAANGINWELTQSPLPKETLEGNYTRWLEIKDVCRNSAKEIVACPGNETSTNTKKVIATIEWNNGYVNQTSTLEIYVYKY